MSTIVLKYTLLVSTACILLTIVEFFAISHQLPWRISYADFVQFLIIIVSVFAFFKELLRYQKHNPNLKTAFGLSILSITLAGIVVGAVAYVYITYWNPTYPQTMANAVTAQGGPYKTGGESAGTNFGASLIYSPLIIFVIKPVLFALFALVSASLVSGIFRYRQRRLHNESI